MTTITTLRATAADSARLAPLFDSYRGFYGWRPDPEGAERFLRQRLEDQDSLVLYAIADGAGPVLGFVQLYPSFSSLSMRPTFILNDLYVCPEARRRGIARTLLQDVHTTARELGAVSLQLETARSNAGARYLYESEGYRLEQDFVQYIRKV